MIPFLNTWSGSATVNYSWDATNTSTTDTSVYWYPTDGTQWAYTTAKWGEVSWHQPKTPQQKLRELIRQRQGFGILTDRRAMPVPKNVKEIRARETLKRVIGDRKFRSFLKNGFISVRAKSGLVYQIFPGYDMTKVYRDGEQVEKLCVVLKGGFPPTDSLIMRYLLILNDEQDFRSHAITWGFHKPARQQRKAPSQPLTELFQDLKKAA